MARPARTFYAGTMNDPWSVVVDTLSGNPRKAPAVWPARKVHRMADDAPSAPFVPKPPPPLRALQRR